MFAMRDDAFAAVALAFATLVCVGLNGENALGEEMARARWGEELVVFGTVDRSHPGVDESVLADIPERMEIDAAPEFPSLSLEPEHVRWEPGRPIDLEPYVGERVEDTAYVFAELHSPAEQTIALGIGADWWIECWMNGALFFDTLERGNRAGRFSILDHKVEVRLREGRNVLAMRFVRGLASAVLAVGDEGMFAAERRRQAARYGLNELPERFEDRLLFPEREQAIVSSGWEIDLSLPEVDLAAGALAGLQAMPERQLHLDTSGTRAAILDTLNRRFEDEPVRIRLSKHRYPYEDRHLDAIVWTSPPDTDADPSGAIEVRLKDGGGDVLASHEIGDLSRSGLFFSVGFPPALEGSEAALEVVWRDGGEEVGRTEAPFRVEDASGVERSGRIPLTVINEPGAVISGAPMTTGVPFPSGALDDEANVRLVDEDGQEVPLQAKVTARWSRFGPVKWLLCDFTADLDGGPRRFHLEYGPDIERSPTDDIAVANAEAGFPPLDAGRVRVAEDGAIEFDAAGDGVFAEVLGAEALRGAFVAHENGQVFAMPGDAEHAVEEIGSEKVVVRRAGWYRHAETGEEFCNYVTRFVFHRGSPVVRIFHTWIFTGDGNRDRIANMGWRFGAAQPASDGGILTAFDGGEWLSAESLVQFDYQRFLLPENGTEREGRTPGVLSAVVGDTRVTFGAKDFWQNFPSEVEVGEGGLAFYNWPKNNPPARFERPVAREDAFRNRFAHEGEVLDFRLPGEYAEGEIWRESSSREMHWAEGRPETANAQGIARTEEMFLYFADASGAPDAGARVMQGLNDETLRAVVDPVWMTGSGVFDDGDVPVHPRDEETFPEVERICELTMEAPKRWVERLGVYGMWLHGDYPTWNMNLAGQTVSTYRTFRGNHHAFPLRWIPFVRSGDPRFFKLAENATRRLADANFCHYATEEVDRGVGPDHFRRQGRWDRSLVPWTGRRGPHLRSYTVDTDYLWQTYYLTGYGRARDVALLFGELTQHDYTGTSPGSARRTRSLQSMITSYLDMYQAVHDPWFLDAAHELADLYLHLCGHLGELEQPQFTGAIAGNAWRAACPRFKAFTGRRDYALQARNNAVAYASAYSVLSGVGYGGAGGGNIRMSAHAWKLTGDPFYLHRLAAGLESVRIQGYEGTIEYLQGLPYGTHGGAAAGNALPIAMAMSILSTIEEDLDPIHNPVVISGRFMGDAPPSQQSVSGAELPPGDHFEYPDVFVRRDETGPFELIFDTTARGGDPFRPKAYRYEIEGPDGAEFSAEGMAPETVRISGPEGIYRIKRFTRIPADSEALMRRLERAYGRMVIPVACPETPEVIEFDSTDRGTPVPAGAQGYWFYVPEGIDEFWIDFTERRLANRVSVWNGEGERVWDISYCRDTVPDRAVVAVPPEHRGRLWKATGGSFVIDPQIPPYFSVRRSKWFDPRK